MKIIKKIIEFIIKCLDPVGYEFDKQSKEKNK